jgi:hypothetical protein
MLPSIDTYLYDQIESKLQIILSNRYIIEEILKSLQHKVAEDFIEAYTGDTAREIPIVYTMPQTKETQRGAIYIGLREGEEDRTSLGNLEGTYEHKDGGLKRELITIQHDEQTNTCFFEVEEPIANLEVVEGISFAKSDNLKIDNNRVDFNYDPFFLGDYYVQYEATYGEEIGLKKGFTATEHYSILVVSTNMDTVRCLDLIIKAILILMRSNSEENSSYLLQKLQFGQVEEIPIGTDVKPELLYGREAIVTYATSYSLDAPILDAVLKNILLNIEYDTEGVQTSGGKEES